MLRYTAGPATVFQLVLAMNVTFDTYIELPHASCFYMFNKSITNPTSEVRIDLLLSCQ